MPNCRSISNPPPHSAALLHFTKRIAATDVLLRGLVQHVLSLSPLLARRVRNLITPTLWGIKRYTFGVKRIVMVRDYRASDLEAVVSLFQRSVHEVASRDYSPTQISAWAPEYPDREAWARRLGTGGVFVYERNDQIAGFARVDETGCVDLLYVHPEVQRQGVARALFDRVISWTLSRRICHLHSEVSVTARPFFESVGFRVVREQIVERQGVSLQNFRMEKDIDAEPLG